MRVIAGTAGGRRLVAPKDVRPTTDRVREAVFSSIGPRVPGAAVLDLYAGSGALGIEALSRGAASAVFVDDDRAAVEACEQNLAAVDLDGRGSVRRLTVERFLLAVPREAPFDLVLADPPYEQVDAGAVVLAALAMPGWLAPGAMVVIEGSARAWRGTGPEPLPPPPPLVVEWERTYGDTLVTALTGP